VRRTFENLRYVAWGVQGDDVVVQAATTYDGKTAVIIVSDPRGYPLGRAPRRAYRQRLHRRMQEFSPPWPTPAVQSVRGPDAHA